MSVPPLFTRKHFEYLSKTLHEMEAPIEQKKNTADLLCRVFTAYSPKFKPALFKATVLSNGRADP